MPELNPKTRHWQSQQWPSRRRENRADPLMRILKLSTLVPTHHDTRSTGNRGHPENSPHFETNGLHVEGSSQGNLFPFQLKFSFSDE
jgi:hypothetical protein